MRTRILVAKLIVAAGVTAAALASAGCSGGSRQAGTDFSYAGNNFNPAHESNGETLCSDLTPCP